MAYVAFLDESGFLLIPTVRRTWAPCGKTPLVFHRYERDKISAQPQRGRAMSSTVANGLVR